MVASCKVLHAVLPAWRRATHSTAAGSSCHCWPRSVPWGFSRVMPRLCCRSWRGSKWLRAFRLFRGQAVVLQYEGLRSQEGWFLFGCKQWHVCERGKSAVHAHKPYFDIMQHLCRVVLLYLQLLCIFCHMYSAFWPDIGSVYIISSPL